MDRVHTSVSIAEPVAEQLGAWATTHAVSATSVIEAALAAWLAAPVPVSVAAGPRTRVGVRFDRALHAAVVDEARRHLVGLSAIVDAMVARHVQPVRTTAMHEYRSTGPATP